MGGDLGGTEWTVPQGMRWGDGPCLRPPNIWETHYRNMQIFGKDVIEI